MRVPSALAQKRIFCWACDMRIEPWADPTTYPALSPKLGGADQLAPKSIGVMGRPVAPPGYMLIGADEHQIALVEIARRGTVMVENVKRNAAAARRSFERGAAGGVATEPEQREADPQAI